MSNVGTKQGTINPDLAVVRRILNLAAGAVGISLEDRENILDHTPTRMTTDYSAAELERLVEGINRATDLG